ncbi:serine/threonine-protein kinase [Lentzea nigeriaca]|uniref:serine/threonine-protein kinase n=1 Tax=Lentzea nigeriaca TaxID=1128665 RepID=UPI0019594F22|nr:serine/threonine-protein kinase [Lentzea nigeriaca]MBM7860747.1 hypothetical protein [Lentzea nigeriaca]
MALRTIAGRYEVSGSLGTGGMGKVWLAYDTLLDRRVALKTIRSDISLHGESGRAVVARFKREARLTAKLEHPGVPAVFDVGAHEDELYLVMQLVDGTDIEELLARKGKLPIEWVAAIGAQIAAVLADAHAASLVHRDLKPRNVMLATGGRVVVLDFGISTLLGQDVTRVTRKGETLGSPAYMAPEQLTSNQVSPLTDLYALGCLLHELLVGTPVFGERETMAMMYAQVHEPPRPVREVRPDVPEPVERLVLDLLAKEPEARPADAGEVYTRLTPYLPRPSGESDAAFEAIDPTRPYRFPLAPKPRPRPAQAAAVEPPSPAAVEELRDRAADLAESGRFTQAAALLADFIGKSPADESALRGVRLQYANTLLLGNEYRLALPEYRRLVRDLGATRGDYDELVLECRSQVATCLAELGEITDALHEFQVLLDMQKNVRSADDEVVLGLRRQIGLLFASTGDLHSAHRVLTQLLTDSARVLGVSHSDVVDLRELVERLRKMSLSS